MVRSHQNVQPCLFGPCADVRQVASAATRTEPRPNWVVCKALAQRFLGNGFVLWRNGCVFADWAAADFAKSEEESQCGCPQSRAGRGCRLGGPRAGNLESRDHVGSAGRRGRCDSHELLRRRVVPAPRTGAAATPSDSAGSSLSGAAGHMASRCVSCGCQDAPSLLAFLTTEEVLRDSSRRRRRRSQGSSGSSSGRIGERAAGARTSALESFLEGY